MEEAFFTIKNFARIDSHIIAIVMGNLNFTLESSNAQTRDAIFKNNIEFMKHNDELL